MKAAVNLLMVFCVVLAGCSLSGEAVEAGSASSLRDRPTRPISNAGAPAGSSWRLGSPFVYKNLTLFPVVATDSITSEEFITLDEGLRSGKVTITELGADGRSHAAGRRQNLDSAEVNRLALTNNSGKPLILIAGEMILGGKQDRIVGHDCIVEASNTPVPLDVFCVEHGRWSGGGLFGQSSRATDGAERIALTGGVAPMALPNIREKAQAKKNQNEVWGAVEETVTVNASESSTGTLKSVYENKNVNKQIDEYVRAFRDKLSAKNIVGIVAAAHDKIISADVFANHVLFEAYWPKMLKSYALEAINAKQTGATQVSKADAENFLARSQGNASSSDHRGIYRLAENQSGADASFELEYLKESPTLIHFNRVAKK